MLFLFAIGKKVWIILLASEGNIITGQLSLRDSLHSVWSIMQLSWFWHNCSIVSATVNTQLQETCTGAAKEEKTLLQGENWNLVQTSWNQTVFGFKALLTWPYSFSSCFFIAGIYWWSSKVASLTEMLNRCIEGSLYRWNGAVYVLVTSQQNLGFSAVNGCAN